MADAQTQAGATPEAAAQQGATPASSNGQQPDDKQQGATPESFEVWLAKQPADIQDKFEKRIQVFHDTVKSERDEKKKLDKRLKELSKSLEDGSDAKADVEKLRTELSDANRRADFTETAHREGVSNIRLAWAAVRELGLVDERGQVDFADLKKQAPELFRSERLSGVPPGNAGAGTAPGSARSGSPRGMNAFIRQAAGKT
jgi:hypothetical protein